MTGRTHKVRRSSGNVFVDLGFPKDEAIILAMRADLMTSMRLLIERRGWTQVAAAETLGISQARVSDLVRGKWEKFSLDMLLVLASRAGLRPALKLNDTA